MPTVGQDSFTEASDTALASHTPDVGAGWSVEASEFTVLGATDNLQHNANTSRFARKGDDIGASAMDVSIKGAAEGTSARLFGPAGRMTTADFTNAINFSLNGNGELEIFQEISGTRTRLAGPTALSGYADGTVYTLKLEIRASSIKGYVDGVERISYTASDPLNTNQYAGIFVNGGTGTIEMDDFLSESVGGGGGGTTYPQLERRVRGLFRGVALGA